MCSPFQRHKFYTEDCCFKPFFIVFCSRMHHLNGLIIESLCHALQTHCSGHVISDCFSNSQDEFVITFDNFYIKCFFLKGNIYFFTGTDAPSKSRLFKPQFSDIIQLNCQSVIAHPFERSFHLSIDQNYQILFKCHGRKSNILLMHDGVCIDGFKRHLEKDNEITLANVYRPISCNYQADALIKPEDFARQYPYLPADLFPVLINADEPLFHQTIQHYRQLPALTFDPLSMELSAADGTTFLNDLNSFSTHAIRTLSFSEQKNQLLNNCVKAIDDKTQFICSNKKALEALKTKRADGEFGNIILAGLHLIPAGAKNVTLPDIYNNTEINISLDPDLNGVENAERYFKKEKGLPHSIRLLEAKIEQAQKVLDELVAKRTIIESANDLKGLKSLVKQGKKEQDLEQLPFRKFEYEGFDIYVGKHADSNEKLLNYYSDKNDTWLHAKDVSGSHVIIRSGKLKIPDSVLERAAALAAYYSKNRKQSLVTVTYTQRKFVRKIKGAEKGKVTVSNEKTLLVKPQL